MKQYIAHRGLKTKDVKENTIASFQNALKSEDYVGFECDIRTTKDHVFVVHHNPMVKENIISLSNYKELKEKYHIPTLEEVLKLKGNKIFLLEIKEYHIDITAFLKLIQKYSHHQIYIMSFYNQVIKKLQQDKKSYQLGVLNFVLNSETSYSSYDFICLLESVVTKELVTYFEERKKKVFIYGIRNLKETEAKFPTCYFITD